MSKKVVILGDSIAKGIVFSEEKNRYTRLDGDCVSRIAQMSGDLEIRNLASMGRTSADALASLDHTQISAGDYVVVEYGGNDSDMPWKQIAEAPDAVHEARVPLPQFTQSIASLIERIRAKDAVPVLTTPLPVDAARYFSWITRSLDPAAVLHWLGDIQHIYRWQERYANAVRKIASVKSVALIDMRDAFLSCDNFTDLLCSDGIHPNRNGHDVLFRTAVPFVSMA